MKFFLGMVFFSVAMGLLFLGPGSTPAAAQQPTGSVPTVTGTPKGPFVKVSYDKNVNVRSGPSESEPEYPIIGVLVPGQIVPALGRTADSAWTQIYYPGVQGNVGWVYSSFLTSIGGLPPVVPTPLPPTPRTTPTVNPALVTALAPGNANTHLPTFTSPPPVVVPTFASETGTVTVVPTGLIILTLIVIGVFGAVISFLRGR